MTHHPDPELDKALRALPELAPDPAFRRRVLTVAAATRQEHAAGWRGLLATAESRALAGGFLWAVAISSVVLAVLLPSLIGQRSTATQAALFPREPMLVAIVQEDLP